ncbi:MAG: TPM domain-containing protein [Rhodocyclaceae bacterium]|nr:TPM domain-containing protein [Rhodocyclaceae bacterium]MCA3024034.1 TPM domain-containing protein [Rhodocyclaceae bacterium]MCA3031906.1 TPM domain-containing protein [Rhodocyclaceae bacterium]MCA3036612.1 TPM domain-containing protein [Rhodocyclaceae bacterium]MCA3039867.1 TPM domain-containing protein [Rhodocyclaceae bacterium]
MSNRRIDLPTHDTLPSYCIARVAFVVCTLMVMLAAFPVTAIAAEGDLQKIPKLEKRVTDLAAALAEGEEARITERIRVFEQKKGGQIAVLIVDTTAPEAIFDYSLRVAESWKIGRKGVDDGVLFVIAKGDRKMQILTGPGVQGTLTDAASKRIIAEIVAPRFREGKYGDGIYNGVDKIASVIDGEALPPPAKKKQATKSIDGGEFLVLGIFAAIFVAPVLRSIFGRFLGATATGGVTGAAAWFLLGGMVFPIFIGVIVFIIALFAGLLNFSSGRGGGWGGGFGGGGGWSGGSGGSDSFSGGGGSFDGGGASGDW